jgi:hypothetical protein
LIALGEQAMQGRLIGNRSGDQGLAGRIAADLEADEPAGLVTVEDAAHPDLVVDRSVGPQLLAVGSSCQQGERGQHDPNPGGSQRPQRIPVSRPRLLHGPPPPGFLGLHAVVVVQQPGLAGAGPAVAGVEHARWVEMAD